jgi:hypothetical protein
MDERDVTSYLYEGGEKVVKPREVYDRRNEKLKNNVTCSLSK